MPRRDAGPDFCGGNRARHHGAHPDDCPAPDRDVPAHERTGSDIGAGPIVTPPASLTPAPNVTPSPTTIVVGQHDSRHHRDVRTERMSAVSTGGMQHPPMADRPDCGRPRSDGSVSRSVRGRASRATSPRRRSGSDGRGHAGSDQRFGMLGTASEDPITRDPGSGAGRPDRRRASPAPPHVGATPLTARTSSSVSRAKPPAPTRRSARRSQAASATTCAARRSIT